MNEFLKQDKIKNFYKSYHNEFLQFIYTNNINIDMSLQHKKIKYLLYKKIINALIYYNFC